MKRKVAYVLLALITFSLGVALGKLARRSATTIEPNATLSEAAPQTSPPIKTSPPETQIHDRYDYRFRTVSITESVADRPPIAIEYPQLIKPANDGEVAFNRFLEGRVHKNYAVSLNLRRSEIRKREGRDPVTEWPLKVTYEVVYADVRIISLKFTHHVTMDGVAHPVDRLETINYDLAQRRPIDLDEMFRPGTGYLSVTDAYSQGRIDERYHDYLCLRDGTPRESKFEHWNLSPTGLVISFDGAQLGEPSIAPESVTVPYELLWGFIGRKSLINRFIDDC